MEEKLKGWWKKENDWIRKCQRSGEGGRIRKEGAGKKRSISENVKKMNNRKRKDNEWL